MPLESSTPSPESDWQRSSFCVGENNCVEVARNLDGSVVLRNSQRPGDTLPVGPAAWRGLLDAIRAGRFSSGY